VASYVCRKVWAGEDRDDATQLGNSVLLQLAEEGRYVYVGGSEVYTFTLDEAIVEYFSHVGNSAVPYPVGLTESSALFMLDRVLVVRDALAAHLPVRGDGGEVDWSDAYTAFYTREVNTTPLTNCVTVSPAAEPLARAAAAVAAPAALTELTTGR